MIERKVGSTTSRCLRQLWAFIGFCVNILVDERTKRSIRRGVHQTMGEMGFTYGIQTTSYNSLTLLLPANYLVQESAVCLTCVYDKIKMGSNACYWVCVGVTSPNVEGFDSFRSLQIT